ncbi:MAG: ribonuclease J [Candidatus Ancillula sp.]|jgi:ribonuclease J|nr:ribonuclease J [Candidatus Ancillula sp.]
MNGQMGRFKKNAVNWENFDPKPLEDGAVRITPLGGLGEVGRNMSVLEIIDPITHQLRILILDCGVLFPGDDEPGVDLILPDFSYIADRLDQVEALVLTHGHEDHIGAVPFLLKLRKDIPLIGSELTLKLVENKLHEHRLDGNYKYVKEGDFYQAGPFALDFLAVNHSVPDALAVRVKTTYGTILDTGDFKMDQTPIDGRLTDLRAFSKVGEEGVDLFMVDSTNAENPGFVSSETEIGPEISRLFVEHQTYAPRNAIYVTTFASNIHRVQQVLEIAFQYNKKVCFVGRSMVKNMALAEELGKLHVPPNLLIDLKNAGDIKPKDLVVVATGSQGEDLAALSRMSRGEHRDINIQANDTVIFASSLIPGNEKSVFTLVNQLKQVGATVYTNRDRKIHCSGHANQGELKYIYNVVRPKNVMPIHGEVRHLTANARTAASVGIHPNGIPIVKDGGIVELRDGKVNVVGKIECGYVYVDGKSVGSVTSDDLEKRRVLSEEGFVAVSATVDLDAMQVITKPRVVTRGMAEDDSRFYKLPHKISHALQRAMDNGESDLHKLSQVARRTAGKYVAKELHRSPMILPIVSQSQQTQV